MISVQESFYYTWTTHTKPCRPFLGSSFVKQRVISWANHCSSTMLCPRRFLSFLVETCHYTEVALCKCGGRRKSNFHITSHFSLVPEEPSTLTWGVPYMQPHCPQGNPLCWHWSHNHCPPPLSVTTANHNERGSLWASKHWSILPNLLTSPTAIVIYSIIH